MIFNALHVAFTGIDWNFIRFVDFIFGGGGVLIRFLSIMITLRTGMSSLVHGLDGSIKTTSNQN